MRKLGILALSLLLLSACDDGGEKKAQVLLEDAKVALAKEDFNEAKIILDSVKTLYPKAFNARKERIRLMQQVDLKEQQKHASEKRALMMPFWNSGKFRLRLCQYKDNIGFYENIFV